MRFQFILLTTFASLGVCAQDTFLMYTRIDGYTLLTDTTTEFQEEPIFFAEYLLTIKGAIGFSRDINILDNKVKSKKKWAVNMDDDRITITLKGDTINGRILTTSMVDPKVFHGSQIRFLLIPIKHGVPIKRLKGRYLGTSINGKWTINFKENIDYGKSKGLQVTEIIEESSNITNGYPLTKYTKKAYGYLVYLGGMNRILVPISNNSDSEIIFDSFPAQFEEPNLQLNTSLQLIKQ